MKCNVKLECKLKCLNWVQNNNNPTTKNGKNKIKKSQVETKKKNLKWN